MPVNVRLSKTQVLVHASGDLDLKTAEEFKSSIDSALSAVKGRPNVVLDLSQVTFLDSSGLGAILGRYRRIKEAGGTLAACSLSPQLQRLFEMTGLSRIIPTYASYQEAVSVDREGL